MEEESRSERHRIHEATNPSIRADSVWRYFTGSWSVKNTTRGERYLEQFLLYMRRSGGVDCVLDESGEINGEGRAVVPGSGQGERECVSGELRYTDHPISIE